MRGCAPFKVLSERCPELLGLDVRGVLDGDSPALRNDLSSSIRTSDLLETGSLGIVY